MRARPNEKGLARSGVHRGWRFACVEGPFGPKQWNGYVGIPLTHAWAWVPGYDDVQCEVHGGLTYLRWSHPAGSGFDGRRWAGFDTLHWDDWFPYEYVKGKDGEPVFPGPRDQDGRHRRTLDEVEAECRRLIDQGVEASGLRRMAAQIVRTALHLINPRGLWHSARAGALVRRLRKKKPRQ